MATVQQTSRIITVKIARQNADGTGKKFMTYKVPVEKWTTVLDAVLDVKKYMDHSIGIRYSCRQATCGSCGMVINGKPRLACFTKISAPAVSPLQDLHLLDTPGCTSLPYDSARFHVNHQ